jgi:Tol biopolymer transport system component
MAGPWPALAATGSVARPAAVQLSGVQKQEIASCPPEWLGTGSYSAPRISANGRFAVFVENAPSNDAGYFHNVYLRDLKRGVTTLISDPAGYSNNFNPSISADGSRVSYLRLTEDGPLNAELWVYHRRTGQSTLEDTADPQETPELSAGGRYVTFSRSVPATVGNPPKDDVFVRDVDRDSTRLVSATAAGGPGNNTSHDPTISADGRSVLFLSKSTDLTADSGGVTKNGALFVRDLRTGRTRLVVDLFEPGSITTVWTHQLSPDGRYVLYHNLDGLWRYDRRTRRTVAASRPAAPGYYINTWTSISAGGRSVAFSGGQAVVVRNVRTGKETVANLEPDGTAGPYNGYLGQLTPDGRFAVFYTQAKTLDPTETAQGQESVYVRDLRKHTTTLVSSIHPGGACG